MLQQLGVVSSLSPSNKTVDDGCDTSSTVLLLLLLLLFPSAGCLPSSFAARLLLQDAGYVGARMIRPSRGGSTATR
jgi:hypothetical protein